MSKSATRKSWYSEQGTTERPSATAGHVDLYRCGKYLATVKAKASADRG